MSMNRYSIQHHEVLRYGAVIHINMSYQWAVGPYLRLFTPQFTVVDGELSGYLQLITAALGTPSRHLSALGHPRSAGEISMVDVLVQGFLFFKKIYKEK